MKRTVSLVALVSLSALTLAQNASLPQKVGKPLPKFALKSIAGERISNASLKGKVVVLDFWATWCGPCRLASPYMQKLHQNYGRLGLRVIGADSGEYRPNPASTYSKQHGYTYAFTEKSEALAQSLGVSTLPAFVLVDKKGVVRKVWTGLPGNSPTQLYSEIEAAVKPLLKG